MIRTKVLGIGSHVPDHVVTNEDIQFIDWTLEQQSERTDRVIIAPVPGSHDRYPQLTLDVHPLHYDEATMAPMGLTPSLTENFRESARSTSRSPSSGSTATKGPCS